MEKKIRILYACSDPIGLPLLDYLIDNNLVKAVLTKCDRPNKRGKKLVFNEIKKRSIEKNIPVLQFETLRTEAREVIKEYNCNMLLCFSYGKIFGPKFLSLFDKGSFNIHPSLLPKYRGSSPLQYTLLNNDEIGGITLQKLALEMDTGDIINQYKFKLKGDEDIISLTDFVSKKAIDVFKEADFNNSKCQLGEASYTKKIEKDDRLIDFNQDIRVIFSKIRTYCTWPKALVKLDNQDLYLLGVSGNVFQEFEDDETKSINGTIVKYDKKKGFGISCNGKLLYVNKLQKACGKALKASDFYNSNRDCIGKVLNA